MHNCGLCGTSSKPGERAEHVVMTTRAKQYEEPTNSGRRRTVMSFKEIVREILVCTKCACDSSRVKKVGKILIGVGEFQFLTSVTSRGVNHANAQ